MSPRSFLGSRGIHLGINTAVAVLVCSLPFATSAASRTAQPADAAAELASFPPDVARAQTAARGTISTARTPVTVAAEGARPIQQYTLSKDDTLATIANFYGVSAEAIAYANGITDPLHLQIGRTIMIPPGEGALYTVVDIDTIESVAARFKVDPAVVMTYNRLYFEPEHFAPGQLVFVPGAEVPGLVYQTVDPEIEKPVVITRLAPAVQPPPRNGRLAWPVGGVITQYFWWGHTGVDLAAPYGTGIGASDAGVVSATGWVPVGGLRVCVKHTGGLETCYYHTGAVYVAPGQAVARGQIIAAIGMTGITTGPHVHWELKANGVLVNPFNY